MKKILLGDRVPITIERPESNFDRACDYAYGRALIEFRCDEDGHIDGVLNADRSRHGIFVEFVGYCHTSGMGGQSHIYEFEAYVAERRTKRKNAG